MVYGVLRFINFAHGDVFMLGAFAGYYLAPVVGRFLPPQTYFSGAVVMVLAMAICALIGMLMERFLLRRCDGGSETISHERGPRRVDVPESDITAERPEHARGLGAVDAAADHRG